MASKGVGTGLIQQGKAHLTGVVEANVDDANKLTYKIVQPVAWDYANQVPTSPWRNAATTPRELARPAQTLSQLTINEPTDLTSQLKFSGDKFSLKMSTPALHDFALVLGNAAGEELRLGYDAAAKNYFVDRRKAGPSGFSSKFAGRHLTPRLATTPGADVTLFFDATSVELFADNGLSVATELFFPSQPFPTIKLESVTGITVQNLVYNQLSSPLLKAAQ